MQKRMQNFPKAQRAFNDYSNPRFLKVEKKIPNYHVLPNVFQPKFIVEGMQHNTQTSFLILCMLE